MLPSPNGSSIAFAAINGGVPVVAGCLRNAAAVSTLPGRLRAGRAGARGRAVGRRVAATGVRGPGRRRRRHRPADRPRPGAGPDARGGGGGARVPGAAAAGALPVRCRAGGARLRRPTSGWPARSTRATWCRRWSRAASSRPDARPSLSQAAHNHGASSPRHLVRSGPHLGGPRRHRWEPDMSARLRISGPSRRRPPCSRRCRGGRRSAGSRRSVALRSAALAATGTATGRPFASPDFQLAVSSSTGVRPGPASA